MVNPEFLSGEASASPAVAPLLECARLLAERGHASGALSARNGLRTTTHASLPLGMLTAQDFVEVADYDPHLDRILCIGRRDPHAFAGMHALVLRAKKEVGAIVMVEIPQDLDRPNRSEFGRVEGAGAGLPVAKRGHTQLESAMGALEALRGKDAVQVGAHVLVTGRTPEEAVRRALEVLGA